MLYNNINGINAYMRINIECFKKKYLDEVIDFDFLSLFCQKK